MSFWQEHVIQEADLYFMDEPLAGVDASTERAIMEILRQLKIQWKNCIGSAS